MSFAGVRTQACLISRNNDKKSLNKEVKLNKMLAENLLWHNQNVIDEWLNDRKKKRRDVLMSR